MSQPTSEPTLQEFPSEDEGLLPGPWRGPRPTFAWSVALVAVLMLVCAIALSS